MNCGRSAGTVEYPARPRISAPQIAATIAAEGPARAELGEPHRLPNWFVGFMAVVPWRASAGDDPRGHADTDRAVSSGGDSSADCPPRRHRWACRITTQAMLAEARGTATGDIGTPLSLLPWSGTFHAIGTARSRKHNQGTLRPTRRRSERDSNSRSL